MKSSNRIAIVGAGLCGMATAFYLLRSNPDITLIDQNPPGAVKHRIDAGMMHPFAGMRARKAPDFDSCRALTLQLLQIAQPHSLSPLFRECGLFRIASSDQERENFHKATVDKAAHFPTRLKDILGQNSHNRESEGLWIPSAIVVNVPNYIQALWRHLSQRSVQFTQVEAVDLKSLLEQYDQVILANGFGAQRLLGNLCPPLRPLRGQWFVYSAKCRETALPIALEDHSYALPIPGQSTEIFAGATFEHTDDLLKQDPEKMQRLDEMSRALINARELTEMHRGVAIRCTTAQHLPIARWIDDRLGVITALGSKGLTRHASLAKHFVELRF